MNRAVASALSRDRPLRGLLFALSKSVSEAGGTVFLAGGYLRDIAEGAPFSDVDVMVAGLSHRDLGSALRSLSPARHGIRKVISAGRHFPVYRIATGWRGGFIDVSAARGGGTARGRDPDACAWEDASRRDFTINGMLYELRTKGNRLSGRLLDPSGGMRDLEDRVIRCVGSAEERLREDPVRAVRAIRMANERPGYRIEEATWRAVRRLAPILLPGVSPDRYVGELLRSLAANPAGTLEDLRRSGILRGLMPELWRRRGAVSRAARRYRGIGKSFPGPLPATILLANLLADLRPAAAEETARRLRFPNVRRILRTLSDLRALRRPDSMRFPKAETEAILARQEPLAPFLSLHKAAMEVDGRPGRNLKRFFTFCAKIPFMVNGKGLAALGFTDGPGRAAALLAIREATLCRQVRTRGDALRRIQDSARPPLRKRR